MLCLTHLENTTVANSTVERNATLAETTFAQRRKLCKASWTVSQLWRHSHAQHDTWLNILVIDTFKPVASLRVSSYVCTCCVWDQIRGINGRKHKNLQSGYGSAYGHKTLTFSAMYHILLLVCMLKQILTCFHLVTCFVYVCMYLQGSCVRLVIFSSSFFPLASPSSPPFPFPSGRRDHL